MKKLSVLFGAALLALSINASASETVSVQIPDYPCIIGNASIYYQDSVYPLLSFRDVTYFPMTYEYCRALDLAVSWVDGKGLYIAYQPTSYQALPVYETTANTKWHSAVLPEYPIYINGRLVSENREDTEYPFLNFRGVTYCPMTWELAREEFAWETNWSEGVFSLETGLRSNASIYYQKHMEDGILFSRWETTDIVNPDGSLTPQSTQTFHKYVYATDALVPVEYDPAADEDTSVYTEGPAAEIRDGVCYLGDTPLPEVVLTTESENPENPILHAEHSVSASTFVLSGVRFHDIHYVSRISYEKVESRGRTTHSYVEHNGKLLYIGENEWVSKAVVAADGNVYFNTQKQIKMIRTHTSRAYRLHRITPDGTIESVDAAFPDYESMEILDSIDGTMYLRCTWCQDAAQSPVLDEYLASPANDGYFTYGGVGTELTKVANYVYADESYVSPSGDIYGIIRWRGEVRKLS